MTLEFYVAAVDSAILILLLAWSILDRCQIYFRAATPCSACVALATALDSEAEQAVWIALIDENISPPWTDADEASARSLEWNEPAPLIEDIELIELPPTWNGDE